MILPRTSEIGLKQCQIHLVSLVCCSLRLFTGKSCTGQYIYSFHFLMCFKSAPLKLLDPVLNPFLRCVLGSRHIVGAYLTHVGVIASVLILLKHVNIKPNTS